MQRILRCESMSSRNMLRSSLPKGEYHQSTQDVHLDGCGPGTAVAFTDGAIPAVTCGTLVPGGGAKLVFGDLGGDRAQAADTKMGAPANDTGWGTKLPLGETMGLTILRWAPVIPSTAVAFPAARVDIFTTRSALPPEPL
mmetsp:Transcript_18039/g.47507  ORF Transcript_18039/g.47507 Transcript_18039/m.47507 type:complete len:140 (-) Transcript_18039:134-553(-)